MQVIGQVQSEEERELLAAMATLVERHGPLPPPVEQRPRGYMHRPSLQRPYQGSGPSGYEQPQYRRAGAWGPVGLQSAPRRTPGEGALMQGGQRIGSYPPFDMPPQGPGGSGGRGAAAAPAAGGEQQPPPWIDRRLKEAVERRAGGSKQTPQQQ